MSPTEPGRVTSLRPRHPGRRKLSTVPGRRSVLESGVGLQAASTDLVCPAEPTSSSGFGLCPRPTANNRLGGVAPLVSTGHHGQNLRGFMISDLEPEDAARLRQPPGTESCAPSAASAKGRSSDTVVSTDSSVIRVSDGSRQAARHHGTADLGSLSLRLFHCGWNPECSLD
jgi:hypothetical protein